MSGLKRGSQMAAELDTGWAWVVLLASFGAHVTQGAVLFGAGIIHVALLEKFHEGVTKTSGTGALFSALNSMAAPVATLFIHRFSCRVSMCVGGLLMVLGYVTTAFATSLNWVILTYGIIVGIGSSLLYSTSVVVIGFNFKTKLNMASGIASAGVGVGMFVFMPVIQAARNYYGYTGFLFVCAGIAMQTCVFGALYRPSTLERQCKVLASHSTVPGRSRGILKRAQEYCSVCLDKALLCFCFSIFLFSLGLFLVFLHLPHYAILQGSTPMQSSWLISVAGICLFLARVLLGLATNSDNVSDLVVYSGSVGVLSLVTMMFPLYSGLYPGQMVYATMLGLHSNGLYATVNSITIDLVGIKGLAPAFAMEMVFLGAGILIGPSLAGVIVDNGGTYEESFFTAGFTILLGSFLGLATVCFKSPREKQDINHGNVEILVDVKTRTPEDARVEDNLDDRRLTTDKTLSGIDFGEYTHVSTHLLTNVTPN